MLTCLSTTGMAQKKGNTQKMNSTPVAFDSAKWRAEYYIQDRDTAYADPRVGLKKLMGGNKRFTEGKSLRPRQDSLALHGTEGGQKPFAIIVGCSDSRVPNEIIFDQGVGDLFIVRTAGQVMAQASYGSIEFATLALGSKLIVVLGHTNCGAIKGACDHVELGNLTELLSKIQPAVYREKTTTDVSLRNSSNPEFVENVTGLNIKHSVKSIVNRSYILEQMIEQGEIAIVGAHHNLETGVVNFYEDSIISNKKQLKSTVN